MFSILSAAANGYFTRLSAGYQYQNLVDYTKGIANFHPDTIARDLFFFTRYHDFRRSGPVEAGLGLASIILICKTQLAAGENGDGTFIHASKITREMMRIILYTGSTGALGEKWNEETLSFEVHRHPELVEVAAKKAQPHELRGSCEIIKDICNIIISSENLLRKGFSELIPVALSSDKGGLSNGSNNQIPSKILIAHVIHVLASRLFDVANIVYSTTNIAVKFSAQIFAHKAGIYKARGLASATLVYADICRLVAKFFCDSYGLRRRV